MGESQPACCTQVELVSSADRCGPVETVDGVGDVAVGVQRADGSKCSRCWNYSTQVRAPGHANFLLSPAFQSCLCLVQENIDDA